jgi:serine/threonine-protein kinase
VFREAIDIDRALFGERHQKLASMYGHLAAVRYQLGDLPGAVRLYRDAVSQYREFLGEGHLNTIVASGNLARMLTESGGAAEAEPLARAALARLDSSNAVRRPHFINVQRTLGAAVLGQGRPEEAVSILERTLTMARSQFGDGDFRTAFVQVTYANALIAMHRYADAEPLLRAAQATLSKHRADQPRLVAHAAASMAALAARTKR